jgi:Na+-transporting methylmalonyl-CoA/oxaloacetate decarboxylase gamma subunit
MFFFSVLLLFAFYFCSVSRISSSTEKTKKSERRKPAAAPSMSTKQPKPRKKTRPERKV